MSSRMLSREIRWAVLAASPVLAILLALLAADAWIAIFGAGSVSRTVEAVGEGAAWLAVIVAIPLIAGIAVVLLCAWRRGRGFGSRGERASFHWLASFAGSLLLVAMVALGSPEDVSGGHVASLLALTVLTFGLLYWPRFLPACSGLELRADAATPPSPRS